MGLIQDLDNKIKSMLEGNFEIREIQGIPYIDAINSRNIAYKVKLCAFYIDMRGSSKLMINQWKEVSAKVHKAFATTVSKVILSYGGKIRDFQGDGILAFWPANPKDNFSQAVKAAMFLKWFFTEKLKPYFEKYIEGGIDFGIGIDSDEVYITRVGITNNIHNNDLVYISPAVNIAVKLADRQSNPRNIAISESVYSSLVDNTIYCEKKKDSGEMEKINMWKKCKAGENIKWGDKQISYRTTTYRWKLE
jgi:class 3 adenylate cyclase